MSSGACCRCVGIREHFPFLTCLTLTLLQLPQPLLDSFLPDVSPYLSLCCFVMVISCCGEWRPYFSNPVPFKKISVAGVTDYTLKAWYLHNHPVGTQITTGYKIFFHLSLTSLKPILLCYLHLQVKVDIFTLTAIFLVCIFLKTMLILFIDSGAPVTLLMLCTALTETNKASLYEFGWAIMLEG